MKIAQITTTVNGGAGLAAARLNEALNLVGANSEVVSQRNKRGQTSLQSKLTTVFQRQFVQSGQKLVTTFSRTELNLKSLEVFDVLHFHATYNLINSKDLIKFAESRKIFLTMHDLRTFTGGCHVADSCHQHEVLCGKCPQVNSLFRKFVVVEKLNSNYLINHKNVHLISPSNWLAGLARSSISSGNQIEVIRNPIPINNEPALSLRNLNENPQQRKFVIGFISAFVDNPGKGLSDLVSACQLLPTSVKKRVHLLIIGKGKLSIDNDLIGYTHIKEFNSQSQFNPYKAMNLLVVPSRNDNSPNVIGEALSSNTKVLGSNVGGIPELLELFGCPVVDTRNPRIFSKMLQEEVLNVDRQEYSGKAQELIGYKTIGTQMMNYYENILSLR